MLQITNMNIANVFRLWFSDWLIRLRCVLNGTCQVKIPLVH
ncbi:hypothetical protein BN2476_390043 [Paraburkholderia piptadeniae]|uniref:Uncharacterized protein n=1 Tax=Paraburkholderia piptadeniae TaxID=1701573 RepID=A0A1N7SAF1_9BURK|nr:hypothetical protein BN2476_390043 [Paraburkholderia piptadeniae]